MAGKSMRADAVVYDESYNILEIAESKFNKAKFSSAQEGFFLGKEVGTMTGKIAEEAGIKGIKVDPSNVVLSEYRWSTSGDVTITTH